MNYIIILLAGACIGTVPLGLVVVRWRRGILLHEEGSSNVGANNAYRTTGSRKIGGLVMVLDLLKGVLAVLIGWKLAVLLGMAADLAVSRTMFWPGAVGLLGSLAAHNYNPVLSLKARKLVGGKGFATAAGGFLLIAPLLVPLWLGLVLVGMKGFQQWRGIRNVIPGNVLATALMPLPAYELYGSSVAIVVGIIAMLALPKHVNQMRELLARREDPPV